MLRQTHTHTHSCSVLLTICSHPQSPTTLWPPPIDHPHKRAERGTEENWFLGYSLSLYLSRGVNNKNVHECFSNKNAPHPHPQSVSEPERTRGHKLERSCFKKRKKETGEERASCWLLLLIHKLSDFNCIPRLKQGSWKLSNKTLAAVIWDWG